MTLKSVIVAVLAFIVGGTIVYYLAAGTQGGSLLAGSHQPHHPNAAEGDRPEQDEAFVANSQPAHTEHNSAAHEHESSDASSLSDDMYLSPHHLNSAFINANGSISERTMRSALAVDDFDLFVERVRSIDSSRAAIEREIALMDQLTEVFGSSIYQSSHACSGEVCTVVFRSVDELSETDTSALGNFADNHRFTSTRLNEYGDFEFRGIYIHTDTPGEMVLDPR